MEIEDNSTLLAITGPTNTGKSMLAADVLRRVGVRGSKTIDVPLKFVEKHRFCTRAVSGRFWGPRGEKIIEENIGSVQNLRRLLGIRWQAQLKTYEENH